MSAARKIIYSIQGVLTLKGNLNVDLSEDITAAFSKYTHEIKYWFEENYLILEISSDETQWPAFTVLMELKNVYKTKFGKQKIGIRDVSVRSAKIKIQLLEGEVEKVPEIKIYYADSIIVENGFAVLTITKLDEYFLKKQLLRNVTKLFLDKLEKFGDIGKKEHWELLWQSPPRCKCEFTQDPTETAMKLGWLKRYPGQGTFFFTPKLTALIRSIEKIISEKILNKLSFQEAIFPKQIPLEIWQKSGHLTGVSSEVFYLCPPKIRDQKEFEDINDIIKVSDQIPREMYFQKLRDPIAGYCYAQCPPFYWFFGGELVQDEVLPIKWFDRSGPSFRWESGGLHGFERLNEFHRIEIVWLDQPAGVIKIRDQLMECYREIFEDIFQLEWRLAKVTPWYYAHSGNTVGVEHDKEKGTIDYESYLPYRGSRTEAEWLEFQNISIHGDKFAKSFKIKNPKENELWTGCSGIGLERWTVTLIAQHGPDLDKWPETMQPYIERAKKLQELKLITWP